MTHSYAVQVQRLADEDGGGWLAKVPDLPGIFGDGETREEALADAEEAIEGYLEILQERGEQIPAPTPVVSLKFSGKISLRVARSLHERIARMAEDEGVSQNQLISTILSSAAGQDFDRPKRKTR